jgi:hypothetical protein
MLAKQAGARNSKVRKNWGERLYYGVIDEVELIGLTPICTRKIDDLANSSNTVTLRSANTPISDIA